MGVQSNDVDPGNELQDGTPALREENHGVMVIMFLEAFWASR